jgi:hypothetical protein
MRKILNIIIGLSLISLVGTCLYFVAGVSSTSPPIKQYEFNGSVHQLLTYIKAYTTVNPSVAIKITDITGNEKNGIATYMDIQIKTLAPILFTI